MRKKTSQEHLQHKLQENQAGRECESNDKPCTWNQMEDLTSDGRGFVCLLSNRVTRCAHTAHTGENQQDDSKPIHLETLSLKVDDNVSV